MKKLVALVVALILVSSVALATTVSFDFSGLSLAQLIEVQQQLTMAMWATEEWQEVEVPQGIYEIGVDIPAGHWTIKAADGAFIGIFYGDKLNDSGKSVSFSSSSFATTTIKSTKSSSFDKNTDQAVYDLDVKDGYFIQIENGTAVFTPYTGKPALGFK